MIGLMHHTLPKLSPWCSPRFHQCPVRRKVQRMCQRLAYRFAHHFPVYYWFALILATFSPWRSLRFHQCPDQIKVQRMCQHLASLTIFHFVAAAFAVGVVLVYMSIQFPSQPRTYEHMVDYRPLSCCRIFFKYLSLCIHINPFYTIRETFSYLLIISLLFIAENEPPECATHHWSPWDECSATCGPGKQYRTREFKNPSLALRIRCRTSLRQEQACTGRQCEAETGDNTEDVAYGANVAADMPECAVSDWSDWSSCSASCGKGFEVRKRKYLSRGAKKKCQVCCA